MISQLTPPHSTFNVCFSLLLSILLGSSLSNERERVGFPPFHGREMACGVRLHFFFSQPTFSSSFLKWKREEKWRREREEERRAAQRRRAPFERGCGGRLLRPNLSFHPSIVRASGQTQQLIGFHSLCLPRSFWLLGLGSISLPEQSRQRQSTIPSIN